MIEVEDGNANANDEIKTNNAPTSIFEMVEVQRFDEMKKKDKMWDVWTH